MFVNRKSIIILGILFFLLISFQCAVTAENSTISTEVEILPGEEISASDLLSIPSFKPGPESNNETPFVSPFETDSKKSYVKKSDNFTIDLGDGEYRDDPFLSVINLSSETTESEKIPVSELQDDQIFEVEDPFIVPEVLENNNQTNPEESSRAVEEKTDESLFNYKGVLWNGIQFVAIVTNGEKSYTVRSGDQLGEGYYVKSLDEKEMILEKEGITRVIKLNI